MKTETTDQFYLVTWVTHNSRVSDRMVTFLPSDFVKGLQPLVFSLSDQKFLVEAICESIGKYGIRCLTFNVLPDHIHMVILSQDYADLIDNIRKIKGYTSHLFRKKNNYENRVWARKFNRVLVENENHLANVISYTKLNHLKHEGSWGREHLVGFTEYLATMVAKVCIAVE